MATFQAANVSFPIANVGDVFVPGSKNQGANYDSGQVFLRSGDKLYSFDLRSLVPLVSAQQVLQDPNAPQSLKDWVSNYGIGNSYISTGNGQYTNVSSANQVISAAAQKFKALTGIDYYSLPSQNQSDNQSALPVSSLSGESGLQQFSSLAKSPEAPSNPQGNIDISQGQTVNGQGQLVDSKGNVIASSVKAGEPANTASAQQAEAATAANPPLAQPSQEPLASATVTTPQPPTQNLKPGDTGDAVKQLQDYLVSQGLMTQAQVNTGYGTYGPQTQAAVTALQQKLGVNNSSGPGYYGPLTISAVTGSPTPIPAPSTQSTSPVGTQVTLGNGQTAYVDTQGNFTDATGNPISNTTVATSTATTTPATSSTPPAGTGLTFDANYGVTQDQWNQMNDVQRATIAAAYTAKQQAYQTDGQQLTFADALTQAAQDPNIIAKYADAAKLDAQTFAQNIQQLQQANDITAQTQQQQFEQDRKALADKEAAAGAAYSGFRNQAQQNLSNSESGIVESSRNTLRQNLQNATQAFEQKYGTAATTPASAQFNNPYLSSNYSISGQYKPSTATPENISGTLAGGITGTQPIAKQNEINTKATDLYNLVNKTPTLS